jgi:hypothetical protein
MKTTVNFLDKNRNKVIVNVGIENGKLSMTGDYGSVLGQIQDHIKPVTEAQKQLVDIWHKWHLTEELPENIEEQINEIITTIKEEEEERKGKPLTELSDDNLITLILEETSFSGRDAELCAAFVKMFDLCENDLQDIEINDTNCTVQGVDYTAGTDEEMDEVWDAELENYIEECILPDVPKNVRNYFDNEAWKRDARFDGRGHALNRYNGGEEEARVNNTYYYAYRQ